MAVIVSYLPMMRRPIVAIAFTVLWISVHSAAAGQTPAAPRPASGPGRVLATLTTLEGTAAPAGVAVELRSAGDTLVVARTSTDGVGEVTIPDVPPGPYVVRASRAGFIAAASAPFDVRAGEVAHVLLD